jgi:hypothetical protein
VAEYHVPDQDDLVSAVRVPLVGGEDYRVKLLSLEPKLKTTIYNPKEQTWWVLKMEAISFADGAPLEDTDGNPVEPGRWLWLDLDPNRLGFQQNGTASKTRQFLLAANGISDMTSSLPAGDTEDLIGREFIVHVEVNKNLKNKVTAFKALGKRRRGATMVEPGPEVIIDPAYAAAVERLMNGEASAEDTEAVEARLNAE